MIEFSGGGVKWFLQQFVIEEGAGLHPRPHGPRANGRRPGHLRDHEMVHVRQFERWGPLMGPAYLGCSLALWLLRRRPYRDNPFEREAFEQGGGEGRLE